MPVGHVWPLWALKKKKVCVESLRLRRHLGVTAPPFVPSTDRKFDVLTDVWDSTKTFSHFRLSLTSKDDSLFFPPLSSLVKVTEHLSLRATDVYGSRLHGYDHWSLSDEFHTFVFSGFFFFFLLFACAWAGASVCSLCVFVCTFPPSHFWWTCRPFFVPSHQLHPTGGSKFSGQPQSWWTQGLCSQTQHGWTHKWRRQRYTVA